MSATQDRSLKISPRFLPKLLPVLVLCALVACSSKSKNPSPFTGNTPQRQVVSNIQHGDVVKAASTGKEDLLLQLLNGGADMNESIGLGGDTLTPLIAAIATRNTKTAAILINNGAALYPTYQGYSAEDLALYLGEEETALLIRNRQSLAGGKGK